MPHSQCNTLKQHKKSNDIYENSWNQEKYSLLGVYYCFKCDVPVIQSQCNPDQHDMLIDDQWKNKEKVYRNDIHT